MEFSGYIILYILNISSHNLLYLTFQEVKVFSHFALVDQDFFQFDSLQTVISYNSAIES